VKYTAVYDYVRSSDLQIVCLI